MWSVRGKRKTTTKKQMNQRKLPGLWEWGRGFGTKKGAGTGQMTWAWCGTAVLPFRRGPVPWARWALKEKAMLGERGRESGHSPKKLPQLQEGVRWGERRSCRGSRRHPSRAISDALLSLQKPVPVN